MLRSLVGSEMCIRDRTTVAQFEFDSSGTQTNGRFRTFEFDVAADEPVDVRLEWQDSTAQLNLFVQDASGATVAFDNTSAGSPKFVTAPAGAGGTYAAAVLVEEGSTPYNIQINPVAGVPEPPPALADFEFDSSGSNDSGRFQSFDFEVVAGELVEAQVIWDDPAADVRIFLRDANGTQIERDTEGSGSSLLTTLAETTGTWSVAVLTASDTEVVYDILVNTSADFEIPGSPTLLSPTQTVATASPTFSWEKLGEEVNQYRLQVRDRSISEQVHNQIHFASDICSADTCSQTIGESLGFDDNHVWRVRAYNSAGWGDWTPFQEFGYLLSSPPVVPTLIAPLSAVQTASPTFSWENLGEEVNQYRLQVRDRSISCLLYTSPSPRDS